MPCPPKIPWYLNDVCHRWHTRSPVAGLEAEKRKDMPSLAGTMSREDPSIPGIHMGCCCCCWCQCWCADLTLCETQKPTKVEGTPSVLWVPVLVLSFPPTPRTWPKCHWTIHSDLSHKGAGGPRHFCQRHPCSARLLVGH